VHTRIHESAVLLPTAPRASAERDPDCRLYVNGQVGPTDDPRDYITAWREHAPWVQDCQVEQDLVISRALVEIFKHGVLHDAFAFRGGTALYKLHLTLAARCSEDLDLVQTRAEPGGRRRQPCSGDAGADHVRRHRGRCHGPP
jgi:hypothetical protein